MAMMIAPVGQGKRDLEDSISKKADDAEGKKADEEGTKVKNQEPDNSSKEKGDGEAYEIGDSLPDGNNLPERTTKGKRPTKPEYTTIDAEGNLTDYGKWYYERPSGFRSSVRKKTYVAAKGDDGVVRDPLTKEEIPYNSKWDMGHKPGGEFRKHQFNAAERRISRKQFLDEHNNPKNHRPETQNTNRSHKLEDESDFFNSH